jgi:HlyD family secretion protein
MEDPRQFVFRKTAIERLTSPDEMTEMLSITRPVDWLILCALALIVAAAIVWGTIAGLPVAVTGSDGKVTAGCRQ